MAQRSDRKVIEAIREFNRFYTGRLGVLNRAIYDSEYTLLEGRTLYEIGDRKNPLASDIAESMGIDEGQFSKLLKRLEKDKLITRSQSKEDKRVRILSLTAKGKKIRTDLNKLADKQIHEMIEHLSPPERMKVVRALNTIEKAFR